MEHETVVTVTAAVPFFPPLAAVMVAVPTVSPYAQPPFTVATLVSLVDQVTVRPGNGVPLASLAVAVNCWSPSVKRLAALGETVIDATGVCTVAVALPVLLSLVAVIVTDPSETPVTSPEEETVATLDAEVPQVTVRPESAVPFASASAALSCWLAPAARLMVDGLTVTVATAVAPGVPDGPPSEPPPHASRHPSGSNCQAHNDTREFLPIAATRASIE